MSPGLLVAIAIWPLLNVLTVDVLFDWLEFVENTGRLFRFAMLRFCELTLPFELVSLTAAAVIRLVELVFTPVVLIVFEAR